MWFGPTKFHPNQMTPAQLCCQDGDLGVAIVLPIAGLVMAVVREGHNMFIPNIDKISQFTPELLLLPVSEN